MQKKVLFALLDSFHWLDSEKGCGHCKKGFVKNAIARKRNIKKQHKKNTII